MSTRADAQQRQGSPLEVFLVFLRLGCTSFGGPVAHMGYFRREFVERRGWLGDSTYGELMAIAHSLPGPGSSQVGFSVGLLRAGWMGGVAAFLGFTLPSALLMVAVAYGMNLWSGGAGARVLHGLQLVAVAVVAQAVVAMQRSLAPDIKRMVLAAGSMVTVLLLAGFATVNLLVILLTAAVGVALFGRQPVPATSDATIRLPKPLGLVAAITFFALLAVAIVFRNAANPLLAAFAAFYRSGALVFGGGHVVLPLLEHAVVDRGWVSQPAFLSGYGAAQAVPGPLFSFGAYLGAAMAPAGQRLVFALVSVLGIFMPGLLAMAAVLPFWTKLRNEPWLRAALLAVNASVVGILAAALVNPLWTSTVHTVLDLVFVLVAFLLLHMRRVQPWMVVLVAAVCSFLLR